MTDQPECALCGDVSEKLFLRAVCHPTAPVRLTLQGDQLEVRCYIPECNRLIVTLRLSPDRVVDA